MPELGTKLESKTADLIAENITKLRELFPEAFSEGKIDFEALKLVLGDEVETEDERYSFTWHGKTDAIKLALKQSTGTLKPCKEESKDWDTTKNIFIEGDNLEVLRILQASYRNKIKMIYIDPPYNTGNDFIYEDDFKDPIKNYKEKIGEVGKANPETAGRYHTNWLNMMYPRLRLARNLLKEDGVIFISIDDNEVHNLRKICDEIFGEENFVASIIWQKKFSRANDATYFSTMHDYILCIAKKNILSDHGGWRINLLPRTIDDANGYANPDEDDRGPWTSVVLSAKSGSENLKYEIETPSGRVCRPPDGRYWSVNKQKFDELVRDRRIWFGVNGDGIPRIKTFFSEVQDGLRPNSLWLHSEAGHNQEGKQEVKKLFEDKGFFDGPKPVRLLEMILKLALSDGDDIVLDFFAGSGTTAHAVMALNAEDGGNRRCISVQIPEMVDEKSEAYKAGYKTIADISKERIRRAGEKIKAEKQTDQGDLFNQDSGTELDIGFKVFKLEETNFTQWDDKMTDAKSALLKSVQALKPDCTQEDALYEILLKYGVDLSLAIQELTIKGKKVYSLADNYLLICLEKELDLETIEEIAKLNPERVVFYDNGFKDDVVKLNAGETLKKFGVKDIRVI